MKIIQQIHKMNHNPLSNKRGCLVMKSIFIFYSLFLFSQSLTGQNDPFITRWNLSLDVGTGTNQLSFTVTTLGTVNYTWQEVGGSGASGSGTFSGTTATITGLPTGATVDLNILPTNFQAIQIAPASGASDALRLIDIKQWGSTIWTTMSWAFRFCQNLNITASDIPNLSQVTSVDQMFRNCHSLSGPSNINLWNVSNVNVMSRLFEQCYLFNQNISNWNVANVTNMRALFISATSFNQNITNWNVSSVTIMGEMFFNATSFNQNISAWVSQMPASTTFHYMLDNCGMSVANYDALLTAFNASSLTGKTLGAVGRIYCASAADRANLVLPAGSGGKGWTISGDALSCSSPEINIKGNGVSIVNGDPTPSAIENTDFGWTNISTGTIVKTYSTENLGAANLTLTGSPNKVTISGTNASDFSVTTQPTSPVTPSGSTTFQITFNPSALGTRTATVSLANDDSNENPYTFAIKGTGTSNPFITRWNLTTAGSGATQLNFGIETTGTVNYFWQEVGGGGASGLGTISGNIATITGLPSGATIELSIDPANFKRININNSADSRRLTRILQWGDVAWTSMENAFYGCTNMSLTTTDIPNLSNVTSMKQMFYLCTNFNGPDNIGLWNTSAVTNMSAMFRNASAFNKDINSWNVAAVTDMSYMFYYTFFNKDISSWNVGAVTNMERMFSNAFWFNQNIGTWNVSSVTNMSGMFASADNFNQNIGAWDVGSVTDMSNMFRLNNSFNQNINGWNVSSVTNMSSMFYDAVFNQNIGSWDVSGVTNMSYMFFLTGFNQNISNWNVSAVTDMRGMFLYTSSFNQNIGNWNVSSVINMSEMFSFAGAFNQNLNNWNVLAVTDMTEMFLYATSFNQSLAAWGPKFNPMVNLTRMLNNSGLNITNYDATLTGFNAANVTGITFGANALKYCTSAAARANLVLPISSGGKGWNITGDYQACPFITRWNLATSGSGATQLSFGVATSGTVNYTWQQIGGAGAVGSGTFSGTTATITGLPAGAIIDLSIDPLNFQRIHINNGMDKSRLTQMKQWGNVAWTSMEAAFFGCNNMTLTAVDIPNTSAVTNMSNMFMNCSSFNQALPNGFSTSAATNMSGMFRGCSSYNQPLPVSFNTSSVTDVSSMFENCQVYNQILPNSFNTSAVTNMNAMFFQCSAYNKALPTSFNTSAVTSMNAMFYNCTFYNQPLPASFNTSAVTNMNNMFYNCDFYDQPFPSGFNTSSVVSMFGMFNGCNNFNQFFPSNFNVSLVTDMRSMFAGALSFNKSLASWGNQLNVNVNLANMLDNCGMDLVNYDATLVGFNAGSVTGRNLGATGRQYCASQSDRTNLINVKGWTITGDALYCGVTPEIMISGNNVSIMNGDVTPNLTDHTDFGSVYHQSGMVTRVYKIKNTGSGNLTIGTVSFSGGNANSDFSVTSLPSSTVVAGDSTTFNVTFDPSTAGTRTSVINIVNDDSDENPFNFGIQGAGLNSTTSLILTCPSNALTNTPVIISASLTSIAPLPGPLAGQIVVFQITNPNSNVVTFSAVTNAEGIASITTSFTTGGIHTIVANFNNTPSGYEPSISNILALEAYSPVALNCPTNTSVAGCQSQAVVNAAFTSWLTTATATGGCNGVLTNDNTGAPSACGGTTTVTFTYTSTCGVPITSCQASFSVAPSPPIFLSCPINTTEMACQSQPAIDGAFASWLATASATGGCDGVLTNDNTGAPSACGGTTTVTFTYTSTCGASITTCQASFSVVPSSSVLLSCPINTTVAACQSQSAVDAAFASWLATASATGGCNGVLTNDNTGAPSACGGTTTVTFTYMSTCGVPITTCQASFGVVPALPIILNCPTNTTVPSCQTQSTVDAAFAAWLATASASGGCNGMLTNNNSGAPLACGGNTTVTFTYTSACGAPATSCQASFIVTPSMPITLNCPTNTTEAVCQSQTAIDASFLSWLSTATASGGCNGILTNNNTGAPSVCGGSTTVVFAYINTCGTPVTSCQATFSVLAPPPISLTCPMNVNVPGGQTQLDVDNAFAVWLSSAEATGGCSGVLTNDNTGAPQAAGGSTTVSFYYNNSCAPITSSCQATFAVIQGDFQNTTTNQVYTTLQAAIDAANSGETIILLNNVSESDIIVNNSVCIEANGFMLTIPVGSLTIPLGKSLTWKEDNLSFMNGAQLLNNGTLCNNGTIIHPDTFTNHGIYKGSGSWQGSFINYGIIKPGN